MCILLPEKVDGLKEVEAHLSPTALQRWIPSDSCNVEVHVPKFHIESTFSLGGVLESMGIRKAFSREADFSRMSDDPEGLYLAAALHKAFVDVNERGTEATAASALVMAASRMPEKPKVFLADRPFLFLIRDRKTRLIRFIGRLTDPC
jgi:serpin B